MAVKVKVELDDQEARQDLKELESEKHKIKLDIEGSYEDILKDIQKLQKRYVPVLPAPIDLSRRQNLNHNPAN